MIKFLLLFVASGLIALIAGPFMPHWVLMLMVAVIAGLMGGNSFYSFLASALAWALVWFAVPIRILAKTESDLPEKIAGIMGVSSELLIAATSLTGFLMAGFAALTGNLFRKLFEKDKSLY